MTVFRKEYKSLTTGRSQIISDLKDLANDLWVKIDSMTDEYSEREIAIAKTKLEEFVMWAVKGITN